MRLLARTVACAGLGLLASATTHAAPLAFSYQELASLGSTNISAFAINNNGQITGWAFIGGVRHAVVWNGTTATDLGPGMGLAINASGQVAGVSVDAGGNSQATRWLNGVPTLLGPGTAAGINENGDVVGALTGSDGIARPAVWRSTGVTLLSTEAGQATAIRNDGQIVGRADVDGQLSSRRAVRWVNDAPISLGGGDPVAVNNAGQVVGNVYFDTLAIPVLWSATGTSTFFYKANNPGYAYGLNNAGWVVGHIYGDGLLWSVADGTPRYVGTLRSMIVDLPANVGQVMPLGINDKNQIVGTACASGASTSDSRICRGFLLTPVTPPSCQATATRSPISSTAFSVSVTLSNLTDNPSTGWGVQLTLKDKTLIYKTDGAKITTSGGLNVTAVPLSTNGTVAAQGSVTFSFRAAKLPSTTPAVTSMAAKLGGQSCVVRIN